ncbi:hypothetical protein LJR175_008394 [Variovorax sp. LjRoot175]
MMSALLDQENELPGSNWARVATIEGFLERVQYMPDVEAEQELLARKNLQAAETARLQMELRRLDSARGVKCKESRDIGYRLQAMTSDNARLASTLKELRIRMERSNWSNAVRAVFGSEGRAQCREWMAAEQAASSAQFILPGPTLPTRDESEEEEVERPRG